MKTPRLRAASLTFAILPEADAPTSSRVGARAGVVAGPLKTTVTLLEDGDLRLCLVAAHFNSPKAANVSVMFRRALAEDLNLPAANVLLFFSHNHTDVKVCGNHLEAYETYAIPAGTRPARSGAASGRPRVARATSESRRPSARPAPAGDGVVGRGDAKAVSLTTGKAAAPMARPT